MKRIPILVALLLVASGTAAQSANDLFQQALVMERSEGDLQQAIALYERVVAAGTDRTLAAQALLRIGENYEKLGLRQARQAYQRVLDDYAEQQDVARVARDRLSTLLAAMEATDSASRMNGVVNRHVMEIPDIPRGTVSPDGSLLSFVDWSTGNVAIRDLRTGEVSPVSQDASWGSDFAIGGRSIWAPDCSQLMYIWYTPGGSELRVYDVDREITRVLVPFSDQATPYPVAWSKDGRHVLALNEVEYAHTNGIILVDTATSDRMTLMSYADNWSWIGMDLSPDGRYAVYESYERSDPNDTAGIVPLHILATDGSGSVSPVSEEARNRSPLWHPDGRHVLFLQDGHNGIDLMAVEVRDGRAIGQPRTIYGGFEGNVVPVGITDDGRYFYHSEVYRSRVMGRGLDLSSAKIYDNAHEILVDAMGGGRSGVVSPDGRRLAVVSDSPGRSRLRVADVETGDARTVDLPFLVEPHRNSSPVWSRDGESILVTASARPDAEYQFIVLVSLKDDSYQLITKPGKATELSRVMGKGFSNQDSSVLHADGRQIIETRVSSGSRRVVYDAGEGFVGDLAVSPDGSMAAVITARSRTESEQIAVVNVGDGSIRIVDEGPRHSGGYTSRVGLSWSSDGNHILFGENERGSQQLFILDVQSGQRTPLGEPISGRDRVSSVQLHPSGESIVFSKWVEEFDLSFLDGIQF